MGRSEELEKVRTKAVVWRGGPEAQRGTGGVGLCLLSTPYGSGASTGSSSRL